MGWTVNVTQPDDRGDGGVHDIGLLKEGGDIVIEVRGDTNA